MKDSRALAILNAISFVIHVSLSYLTQLKAVNQFDNREISDRYPTLFTPAPVTFSIWGVIYTALFIFCLYHIVMAFKRSSAHPANESLRSMGALFMLANLGSAAWLLAFTHDYILLSTVLIFVQLMFLIALYLRLGIFRPRDGSGSVLCTQMPVSLYLAWISLATIANTSVYLVSIGWDGWGVSALNWTLIMLGIVIALGIIMVFARRDIFFGLVVIWGLYGIMLKIESQNSNTFSLAGDTAMVGMAIVALACLVQAIQQATSKKRMPRFPEAKSSLK